VLPLHVLPACSCLAPPCLQFSARVIRLLSLQHCRNTRLSIAQPPNLKLPPQNGDIMSIPGAEDQIDPATFEQILEMDEDEVEREFSKSIVYDFFGQADQTFKKMDKEL